MGRSGYTYVDGSGPNMQYAAEALFRSSIGVLLE
jgi:hypothetical protein